MRICWPQVAFIALVVFIGVSSMLSGCGKKGPLKLPPSEQPSQTTNQNN